MIDSVIHVCALVDGCWHFIHFNFESVLNCLQNVVVLLAWDEWNGKTLSSESSGSSNSVEVLVWLVWHVEVDDNVDLFNIDSSSKDISGYHDSIFGFLELVVDLYTFFLWHITVTSNCWESLLVDNLTKFLSILLLTGENDDLVEVKII